MSMEISAMRVSVDSSRVYQQHSHVQRRDYPDVGYPGAFESAGDLRSEKAKRLALAGGEASLVISRMRGFAERGGQNPSAATETGSGSLDSAEELSLAVLLIQASVRRGANRTIVLPDHEESS